MKTITLVLAVFMGTIPMQAQESENGLSFVKEGKVWNCQGQTAYPSTTYDY